MEKLKKDMQAVLASLKQLTKTTQQIAKKLEKMEKSQASVKPKSATAVKRKAVTKTITRKPKMETASDTVLSIIMKHTNGIDTATMRKETGFNDNKMRGIVFRLKQQGKIKSAGRGIYVPA